MDNKIPHILIVDDDANLLATMSDILKLKGFEPVSAQTGGVALALLEKHNFDLALLDLRLEDMPGLKVLSAIKAHSPETECILLTGHASQNSAIEAIQMGVYGYFQKPFDMEQVLLSIQRALEKSDAGKALYASELRYRSLFEDSPVALREEDFSEVKQYLDLLKKQGITDFQKYFVLHPEIVFECAEKVKIVDVNKAALKMFRAKSKNSMPINFTEILDSKAIEHFRVQLANIAEGQTKFNWEGIDHTVDGQQIDVEVNWLAAAGHEEDLSKVIVSLQDITERKQAEKQIHILSRALEQSPTSILITDVRGNIEYVNPKFSEITGYGLDEVLGENPRILQSGNTTREEYKKLWETILSGNIWQGEFLNRKKSGEKYWENATIAPVFSNDGKITNFLSLNEDNTERRQEGEALQNSEKRFRALIENGRDNISLLAADATLLWESPSTRSTLGYAPDQFVGHNLFELVHPEDQDPIQNSYAQLVQSPGKSQDGIFRLRHGDGTWRWIESTATNMLNEPSVQAIVINYRDITERKQAEETVLESEERFRVIFEKANDAIHIDNADDKILAVNSRMCELMGYSSEELLKMHVTDLQVPETRQPGNVVKNELARHGTTIFEGLNLHRDGRRIPVEISIGTIELPGGALYISVVRDITERKQAQKAQQQSERQFRALFELSPDAVMLIDPHDPDVSWPIIDCNEAACQMNGYHREELIGHSVDIINLTSALQSDRNAYLKQVREAGNLKLESFHRHKNGTVFPIEISTTLIKIGDRELLIGIDRDITERKQNENALITERNLLRTLIDILPDYIFIKDVNNRLILDNIAHQRHLGASTLEDVIGKTDFDFFPKEIAAPFIADEQKIIRSGEAMIDREEQSVDKNGNQRWLLTTKVPLRDLQGMITGIVGINHDITERKQVEDALKNGHTHLEERTAELSAALRETEGLFSTVQDILTSTHLTQICQSLMAHFIDLVKAERITLYLVDHQHQEILLGLTSGNSQDVVPMTYQELNIGISGQVFKSGQPVLSVSTDDGVEPPETNKRRVRDNASSLIVVPLLTRKGAGILRVVGTVTVINRTDQRSFTHHDKDLLMMMATQAAAAIENIRQYEETSQRVTELEVLYQSGLAFSQLITPKAIAEKIIDLLGEKLNWHHTAIRLAHAQDKSLELLAFDQPGLEDKAEEQAVKAHLSKSVSGFGEGLSGWALKQTKIIRLGNVGSDPHYVQTFPGIQSGLYVPLKSGDRMLGVISIESEQPNAFSEADEQLLTTLANQAANAFENARLYEETNRYAQEMEMRVQERTADLSRVNVDLEHAVRVKDEFLASMSHELRTPLTGILGLSEVLQLKVYGELNDKQGKTLKTIEESGRHLLELINDILDLSKIEAGKLELQFAPCSLAEVCQASLQIIKGMAQQKGQHVYYAPPPKPIIIRADARRLKQLLVNLLSNAIKFTPQNGDLGLEIEAIESEQKFKVTVWDKGIGIKPENLPKLFMPFTQLDSGLAREYSGTGLGLSLVKHLTELHNGGIEVESKIGEGSRFTIILPWSPHDTTPIPYPHLPQRAVTGRLSFMTHKDSASPLVMIVDDNEMVLQMVADFLETKQYRVMKIHSGSELLERAAEFHPDIMLVDIQMPGIGGLETIRRIRSHTDPLVAAAPVIAITALAMPADREHCLRAGANDYMSKPLKLKELAATIQKLLERKQ